MEIQIPEKANIEFQKLRVERWKVIVTGVGSVLVPLAIAYFTLTFQHTSNEQIEAKYVDLAISILREEPDVNTEHLRKWAIEVINWTSPIKLTTEAIDHFNRLPKNGQ